VTLDEIEDKLEDTWNIDNKRCERNPAKRKDSPSLYLSGRKKGGSLSWRRLRDPAWL
jgi:hypothetical protein